MRLDALQASFLSCKISDREVTKRNDIFTKRIRNQDSSIVGRQYFSDVWHLLYVELAWRIELIIL